MDIKDIEKLEEQAKQGDAESQINLGICYYKGNVEGVKQNYEEAVKWFKEAAKQGASVASFYLRMCYYYGKGVEQNYEKAVYWFEKAAEQGNAIAKYNLGICYYDGIEIKQNYKEAVKWFTKAAEQEHAKAQSELGNCYLYGIGTEQNFKEAERLFKKSVKNGNKYDEYNTKIFEQMQGKEIQQIKDISEKFDEENVGAVLILPQENKSVRSHTLYDIETYRKIKRVVNEILEDVEDVNQNKDNEFDVFMKIYTKLGRMISYDDQAAGKIDFEARNLIGGLLKGKCVCAGYAEILRNVLSCKGIECIYISADGHSFNQVKIRGKWYYCDLTDSVDSLCSGENVKCCLLSKEEFEDEYCHIAKENQTVYPSPESYPQEKVNEAVNKIISSEKEDSHNGTTEGTDSRESQEKGLEKQIDVFANSASSTCLQKVTNNFETDNNRGKEPNEERTKDSSLVKE